jgi:hypothetical protein
MLQVWRHQGTYPQPPDAGADGTGAHTGGLQSTQACSQCSRCVAAIHSLVTYPPPFSLLLNSAAEMHVMHSGSWDTHRTCPWTRASDKCESITRRSSGLRVEPLAVRTAVDSVECGLAADTLVSMC